MPGLQLAKLNMNGANGRNPSIALTNGISPQPKYEEHVDRAGEPGAMSQNGQMDAVRGLQLANGVIKKEENKQETLQTIKTVHELPPEVKHITQGYQPLSKLIRRSIQPIWLGLSALAQKFSETPLPRTNVTNGIPNNLYRPDDKGDQSAENLRRKQVLLKFCQDHKDTLVKVLVLSKWSRNAADLSKVIDLHVWADEQRGHFLSTADLMGEIKRELAFAQMPNPDLRTAAEILSTGKSSQFGNLGYVQSKPLSADSILNTLKTIDRLLAQRLASTQDLPQGLQRYRIHDGRVTFSIPESFDLDLSIADEAKDAQFFFVDFRFAFTPCAVKLEGRLLQELENRVNTVLEKEGIEACYDLLMELTCSYKINTLFKQARDLARRHWSENITVELIHRTLIVQYWTKRSFGKSWIEIGVVRPKEVSLPEGGGISLKLKWFRQAKLAEDVEITISQRNLSMEQILRKVIVLHSSFFLEAIFDRIAELPLYADGQLDLDFSISEGNTADCVLELQLSQTQRLSLSIESISGSPILRPTSAIMARAEFDLQRSKDIVTDVAKRLEILRCQTAEQSLTTVATGTGWQNAKDLRLNQVDLKEIFGAEYTRYVFLKQAKWNRHLMLSATYGRRNDSLWLFSTIESADFAGTRKYTAHALASKPLQVEERLDYNYMFRLSRYAAGVATLQANAEHLDSIDIRRVLPKFPDFDLEYQLPQLTMQFETTILQKRFNVPFSMNWKRPAEGLPLSSPRVFLIQKTVSLSFIRIDADGQAVVEVRAQMMVPISALGRSVLAQVANSIRKRTVSLNQKGVLLMRFRTQVGLTVIEQAINEISQIEGLCKCLLFAAGQSTMQVDATSRTLTEVRYGPEKALIVRLVFESAREPQLAIELGPDTNPHKRIRLDLEKNLNDSASSFATAFTRFLPLLSFTLPLLSALDETQRLQELTTPSAASQPVMKRHIMPRDPTHYSLQYSRVSAATTSTDTVPSKLPPMLARFEILPHARRNKAYWVVRPAIEEKDSYSRNSWCSHDLKRAIDAGVFGLEGAKYWLPLDGGAACDVGNPAPLLKAIDEAIVEWVKSTAEAETKANPVPEPISEAKKSSSNNTSKTNSPEAAKKGAPNAQQQRPNNAAPVQKPASNSIQNRQNVTPKQQQMQRPVQASNAPAARQRPNVNTNSNTNTSSTNRNNQQGGQQRPTGGAGKSNFIEID